MEELLAYLQGHKAWSSEEIEQALGSWQATRQQLLKTLEGQKIYLDPEGYLVWERFPEQQILERIPILNQTAGLTGSRSLVWLDPETGQQQDIQILPSDSCCGLVIASKQVFLHHQALESAPKLAQTNIWVDTALPDTRQLHIDLQVLPERDLLFVMEREAGTIHVYHLRQRIRLTSWQIRTPGHALSFNLTFDRAGTKAYLTDNLTPQLWIADLVNLELKLWKSGLGVLGNLLASPEPGCLFLTILEPHFNLVYFDLDSMSPQYSVEIRGEPFTQRRLLAWDPFMAAADSGLLFYLAVREQGGQMLPVLNIIDTEEIRTIRRTVVRSSVLPVMMVSGPDNPLLRYQKLDFASWLIAEGKLSSDELKSLIQMPLRPDPLPQEQLTPDFEAYQPPAEDPEIWQKIDAPAAYLELPPQAEDVIVELISWAFYRLTLTNLSVHPAEIQKLKKQALSLRQELQTKEAILVKVAELLGRFSFETPLARASVLELLEKQQPRLNPAEFCPFCQRLWQNERCSQCGFCLSKPSAGISLEASSHLVAGQSLIPYPDKSASLINLWGQALAVYQAKELKSVSHALMLAGQTLLMTDREGHKMLELSPQGETLWKARLALKQPVIATAYQTPEQELHFLVVDQGNGRVLELDRQGKHWRRYPTLKTAVKDKLKQPSDVQVLANHDWLISDPVAGRVLQVNRLGQLVAVLGDAQGLKAPYRARRQQDGSTEVLDLDLGSILRFDATGQLIDKFDFWPFEAPFEQASRPYWAGLTDAGEWLLLSRECLALVAPQQQKVRWLKSLPDAEGAQSLLKGQYRAHGAKEQRRKQLDEYALILSHNELLKRESGENLDILARHLQPLSFDAGDWLLYPGELGSALYFVYQGCLEVIAPDKEQPVIFEIKAGQSCGSQSVLSLGETGLRPGFRVKEDCQLLMLERSEFKKAVVSFPRLFHLVRHLDREHQRQLRLFVERKTEAAQDQLRVRLNETRIREFALFEGAEADFFEALAEAVHAVAYLPDQTVFRRGEAGDNLFLILEGSVSIQRRGDLDARLQLAEGEIFGEMAVILEQERTASVRTLDYCKFFVLEEKALKRLCEKFPWFWERLLNVAQARLQANQVDWDAFRLKAGLDLPGVPTVQLQTPAYASEERIFMPSLHHDSLSGLSYQGDTLWFWGQESKRQLFHPSRLHQLENSLLVTDTGNNRVLEIDLETRKTRRSWSGTLKHPRSACLTPEGLLLVADQGNQRLVVMDESGREVWQYGLPEEILAPVFAEITPEGHILFADTGMHKVYELSLDGRVLWSYGRWRNPGAHKDQLAEPCWAHRLHRGATLIADTANQRLVLIEPNQPASFISLSQLGPEFRARHLQFVGSNEYLVFDPALEQLARINLRGELLWQAQLNYPEQVTQPAVLEPVSQEERWSLELEELSTSQTASALVPTMAQPANKLSVRQTEIVQKRQTEILNLGSSHTSQVFWKELGVEVPSVAQAAQDWQAEALPELLPELDEVLEQVADDLEAQSEAQTQSALDYLSALEKLDLGTTLNIQAEQQEASEEAAGDELDFLDSLISDTGQASGNS